MKTYLRNFLVEVVRFEFNWFGELFCFQNSETDNRSHHFMD